MNTVEIDGKKFYTALSKEVAQQQYDEIFKVEEYKAGRRKRGMVVVDAGACMGLASLYFKDWAKKKGYS